MKEEIGLHTCCILGIIVFLFMVLGMVPTATVEQKQADQFNTERFLDQTEEYIESDDEALSDEYELPEPADVEEYSEADAAAEAEAPKTAE